ncbi:MAG TPA: hypothetical protein VIY48_22445 [Candidatus Paceibacterota bacterium]
MPTRRAGSRGFLSEINKRHNKSVKALERITYDLYANKKPAAKNRKKRPQGVQDGGLSGGEAGTGIGSADQAKAADTAG